jgi:hypothetical protein
MYEEPVFPWQSLGDAVEKVGLLETTSKTGEQLLEENGIGSLFAEEIVQARYVSTFQSAPCFQSRMTMKFDSDLTSGLVHGSITPRIYL